jgi:hypothetical protein
MSVKTFKESSSAPTRVGNTWRAVLITPGKGASGIYSESVLREYGPIAFPKGTHSYVDHPSEEGEVRSPKNLIGVLAEDAKYEKGVGVVAKIQVMPHWKEFVEAVAPHTGLSIYAMGEGSQNDDGDIVVESLVPNVQNSVDLVSYAGRPGSKLAEKLYESAIAVEAGHLKKKVRKKKMYEADPGELAEKDLVRMDHGGDMEYGQVAYIMTDGVFPFEGDPLAITATEESPVALIRVWMQKDGKWEPTEMLMGHAISDLTKISALGESEPELTADTNEVSDDSNTKEGNSDMDIEELSNQIAALPALIASAVVEALAPQDEPADMEESLDVAAIAEAIVAANLPEVSRNAVYESLRNGGELTASIEGQKAFVESVKSHLKETAVSAEETFIVSTTEKAESLSGILNVKVGK